jgi:LacI family transcriptional regulator
VARPTAQDLAEQLGVSVATVSRALNGQPYVKRETRERVERAAREAGYQPNILARALRREETKLIGLIVPDVSSEFFALATAILQHELEKSGYQLMLCVSHDDPAVDRDFLLRLVRQRVDGIVHVPCTPDGAAFLTDVAGAPPVVELNRRSHGAHADTVAPEDRIGAAEATRHLLGLVHKRIAILGGNPQASTTVERLEGFREAAAEAGIESTAERAREYSVAWGYEATSELLTSPERPTAIFATNTQLTAGALQAIADQRLRIPRDLSVVGFDDPPWYRACQPGVTTYADPLRQMARLTAELLLRRIGSPDEEGSRTHYRLSGQLVVRGSTGKPPKSRPVAGGAPRGRP